MPVIPLIFKQQTVVALRNISNHGLLFLKQKNENYYATCKYEGDKLPGGRKKERKKERKKKKTL